MARRIIVSKSTLRPSPTRGDTVPGAERACTDGLDSDSRTPADGTGAPIKHAKCNHKRQALVWFHLSAC